MGLLRLPLIFLRFFVFISLGTLVLSLSNCAPESNSNNPPQSVEKYY